MLDPIGHPVSAANAFFHIMVLSVALALVYYDRTTPTTRALSGALALWGSEDVARLWLRALDLWPPDPLAMNLGWLGGSLSTVAAAEYVILVLRTVHGSSRTDKAAHLMLRINQALVLAFVGLQFSVQDWLEHYQDVEGFGYGLFKSLEFLIALTFALPVVAALRNQVDLEERRRALALVCASPFFLTSGFLPNGIMQIISASIGLLIILVGSVGYLVAVGKRGEFLARFLSPQIRQRVHDHGLQNALQQCQKDISVVCSDVRRFTAYSERASSEHVIDFLRRYYDAAGEVVARHQATIKDFAGDGLLILVGAPQSDPDHARTAITIAHDLRAAFADLTATSLLSDSGLGIGIGIASGPVTVGVIDSKARMEYAAVGSAVNLSARLCAIAGDGEILVSDRTRLLSPATKLTARPALPLKGFADPVDYFAVAVAGAASAGSSRNLGETL